MHLIGNVEEPKLGRFFLLNSIQTYFGIIYLDLLCNKLTTYSYYAHEHTYEHLQVLVLYIHVDACEQIHIPF
jgi:hypothetical protein